MASCTLGIDVGTYESKAVLVDGQGRIVGRASRPHEMLVPRPGWAEHRPDEDWWGDLTYLTRAVLDETGLAPSDVGAIGCSAIGPCMLPVDAHGRPLMNAVLYGVDARAVEEIAELVGRIGEDVLLDRCGNPLTTQSVGPKILWLKRRRPALYAQTAKVLTSTSYLVFRLTGEYVIDHFTAANFTPLYVVDALDWSSELADDIIGLRKLPRLAWSGEIAGTVTRAAARETGLAEGTPVTVGTVDAAAEALSVGVTRPGDMMLMYGSTIFIVVLTDTRVRDPRLWYAPWLFEGGHASAAGLATSGTLTHWFRDRFARDLDPAHAFEALAREAEGSPPGANGLLFLPYFSGERTPIHDPLAKGCLFGLDLTHTRGDVYRAILEGIANGTHHVIETCRAAGQAPRRLLAVGGGTKNRVWRQATSDVSGLDQILCETTVGASYGDAFLAAMAIGEARIADIETWNPVSATIAARPSVGHGERYRLFRRLYEQTKDIAHALGAPG